MPVSGRPEPAPGITVPPPPMPAASSFSADGSAAKAGRIVFVGAGPGAADLLTLRAAEWLRRADVIVHDTLVPTALLDAVGAGGERIAVSRADEGDPGVATGRLLVARAAGGRTVVRLKGGDPTVFARLAEELEPVRSAGIPHEFVPGVTAGLAAAAAAGVPLTSRAGASSLTLVTGHDADDRVEGCDFSRIAAVPGTIVVYMGVEQSPRWARAMIDAGRPADTPVTLASRCSWPDERIVATTLGALADESALHGWQPPVAVIVGAAASPPSGPLAGRTVLVTRPEGQGDELAALVRAGGGTCLQLPLVRIGPPDSWRPLDEAIGRIDTYDWIVFASANGVRSFVSRLREAGRDGRALGTVRLAAIGPATRRELEAAGFAVDVVPSTASSEGLAAMFATSPPGGRFLLVRADRGRDVLKRELEAGGHHVEEVAAYASRPLDVLSPDVLAELDRAAIDWVTVTSPVIASAAVRLLGERLRRWRIASISPLTSAALAPAGLRPAAEAVRATAEAIVEAIVAAEAGPPVPAAESVQPAG